MAVRTLIVDDSAFFRRRILALLAPEPGITVVGEAANGLEAVEAVARLRPDVVTMDVEMPVLDGIAAVRRIMRDTPTAVLMFSSFTDAGARATLDALAAGALDFLPKRWQDMAEQPELAARRFCDKVLALGRRPAARATAAAPALPRLRDFELVTIGASTGGPVAIERLLQALPAGFTVPVVVLQHMPAAFTAAYAARLDGLCAVRVREATDGGALAPGVAYVAPGGRQLRLQRRDGGWSVRFGNDEARYGPSVDVAFGSLAACGAARTLAIVLTGMGADGRDGARLLKRTGATVWAQDESSSVVWGMPQAVIAAGLADEVLSLSAIETAFRRA